MHLFYGSLTDVQSELTVLTFIKIQAYVLLRITIQQQQQKRIQDR